MRVFFKEGSNVSEVTRDVNKYKADTYLMSLATTDAIYISSDFPLNSLFIKMGAVVNEVNSVLNVSYWSTNSWVNAVHINDYTDAFSQSGFIEFTPDRDESWMMSSTNSGGQTIDDLTSIVVYDQYWTKITVDTTLTDSVEIEYIGHIFSDDQDLFSEFPIFNDSNFLVGFEADKTSWQEQHVKAAELIIQDMKRKSIIIGAEQILDRSVLIPASVCKVAEIIFNAFGNDYTEQVNRARAEYDKRMDLSRFVVDVNNNAIKEPIDVGYKQGWLSR